MITREKWGRYPYDVSAPNVPIAVDTLMDYCQDAVECGDAEMPRLADISAELALHPLVARSDRLHYGDIALTTLDALVEQTVPEKEPRIHIAHALLPGVCLEDPKLSKAYRLESFKRTLRLSHYLNTYFNDTLDESVWGPALELLDAVALRSLGFSTITSMRRQDEALADVDGLEYRWDVTGTVARGNYPRGNYLVQSKHSARHTDEESSRYHPDIVVHTLQNERRAGGRIQNVFTLLQISTGQRASTNGAQGQYEVYLRRLTRSLRKHGASRTDDNLLVRAYIA